MRMTLLFFVLLLILACREDVKKAKGPAQAPHQRAALSLDSQIFLGNRLFSEKTCITCHNINTQKIGPSIVEIMEVYKKEDGDIVAFLKGEQGPIVDTTASQVAIMQANIDGFLQNISDEELQTIAVYMMHVDERQADQKR
ncbi:c-type cytochrome [Maribacter sp. 2307ULW6-5]|uniref:c-type cytochrome n=1 Tax=Maribacter sp. 2307ULW6-5 TaxID=3386275 RepID=UPI0039BD7476